MTFRQRFRKAADDIMTTIFLLILVTISGITLCLPAVEAMPTIVRQVLFRAAHPVIVLTFLCLLSGMGTSFILGMVIGDPPDTDEGGFFLR